MRQKQQSVVPAFSLRYHLVIKEPCQIGSWVYVPRIWKEYPDWKNRIGSNQHIVDIKSDVMG